MPPSTAPLAGTKRKRTRGLDAEPETDELEEVRPSKQSQGLCFLENPQDSLTAEASEQTERPDSAGMSEPQCTPKLYLGGSKNVAGSEAWSHFADFLRASPRVLCLVGAGLSAPSGLATWRGTNGLWNDIDLKELASPKKFQEDPVTVWNFYGERLLKSLAAQPNAAHHALAALARSHDEWLTINQNVDGMNTSLDWSTVNSALIS